MYLNLVRDVATQSLPHEHVDVRLRAQCFQMLPTRPWYPLCYSLDPFVMNDVVGFN